MMWGGKKVGSVWSAGFENRAEIGSEKSEDCQEAIIVKHRWLLVLLGCEVEGYLHKLNSGFHFSPSLFYVLWL